MEENFRKTTKLIIILLTLIRMLSASREYSDLHEAVTNILTSANYSSNLLPPTGSSPLKLFVNFGLREIEDIDDKKMELKVQLALRLTWTDTRLQYAGNGSTYITLQSDTPQKPWTPDIFIHREKESILHSITKPNTYIRAYPNGTLRQSIRVSVAISCFMHLKLFPFDHQTCEMRLMSYAYSTSSLQIYWDPLFQRRLSSADHNKINSDHLTQFRLVRHALGRCVSTSGEMGNFSAVFIRLKFQRQWSYYSVQVFLPNIMLVALTWITFWLGEAVEARLSMTVTIMLTLGTQISSSAQTVTMVSYTTAFSLFGGICTSYGAFSIFETALVFCWTLRRNKEKESTTKQIEPAMSDKHERTKKANVMAEGERGEHEMSQNRKILKPLEHLAQAASANVTMWRRRITLHPTAVKIDEVSKVLFPVSFGIFVVVYFWVYFCHGEDEQDAAFWNESGHDLEEDRIKPCLNL